MKKNSGITLVSLVITVIILALISSITVRVSTRAYEQIKIQNFISQLKVIQSKVDQVAEQGVNSNEFMPLSDVQNVDEETYNLFTNLIANPEEYNVDLTSWTESDNEIEQYYYLDSNHLQKLGLKDQEMTVAINFKTRNVISKKAVKIDGKEYYRQYDLREYGGDQLIESNLADVKTYTITYNTDGGSEPPANQIKKHGENLTLTTEIPIKLGYVFKGWAKTRGATTAMYVAGSSYHENSSVTLYAVWGMGNGK